ncbi:hypothetical protein IQ254_02735 [Nodosilinea sp. LEGE 07088]|uniref:hypothetical protein n=1 Tax=Nodosilinea sp. LEGE 07088 TaxID=2777968 RepID=UPI001882D526|nr:hypothetical protein [Nodosilinea sp. LEGE 07088]MBE9136126.1 hypothetical protein [Nodosilinea sp. LEGE 07088]
MTERSFTDVDRVESLKAAVMAGVAAGCAAAVLLLLHRVPNLGWGAALRSLTSGLSGSTFWLSAAIAGISGGLFGITYRYAVRQDNNSQLKAGVVLAFSLVRGLALVNVAAAVSLRGWPFTVAIAESLLMFVAAAVVLEVAQRQGWVKAVN